VKLHLGCGERYLDGYINIDFPLNEHSVQIKTVADFHRDLRAIRYSAGCVDEIRLHHVFEHFPRHIACALIASWQSWLKNGGVLRIEVPDLLRTGMSALNPFSSPRSYGVAVRHLFGSHEADWAAHREAYTGRKLRSLLNRYGFSVEQMERSQWRGTYNIDVIARKKKTLDKMACAEAARDYLRDFLLDDSDTEARLLNVWMTLYGRQVDASWASDR